MRNKSDRSARPCFLCPAKYVEEEFDDDDVDVDDGAAESTPRLRCDGIAGKHEPLLLRLYLLKTSLFAESEGYLYLSQLITGRSQTSKCSHECVCECRAQDDIWSGPSVSPDQHGIGKRSRKRPLYNGLSSLNIQFTSLFSSGGVRLSP